MLVIDKNDPNIETIQYTLTPKLKQRNDVEPQTSAKKGSQF